MCFALDWVFENSDIDAGFLLLWTLDLRTSWRRTSTIAIAIPPHWVIKHLIVWVSMGPIWAHSRPKHLLGGSSRLPKWRQYDRLQGRQQRQTEVVHLSLKTRFCILWFCSVLPSMTQRLTFRFRNFSVSKLLPNLWGILFRFWKIWFRKKSLSFGFEKIWSRKKVSVSENLVSEKKKSK